MGIELPRTMPRVFIGYDDRQPVSYNVCQNSVYRHSSGPVQITPLILSQLPISRQGLTQFTFTRFLIPWLCHYEGWAIFMDCDFLVLDDIYQLMKMADDKYVVMVVKHPMKYERASLIMFNCAKCQILTPEFVKSATNLHTLGWVDEEDIGEIPPSWNHLVGYDYPNPEASIVHFTQGMPNAPILEDCEFSKEWHEEYANMLFTLSWEELMGGSNHATSVFGKRVPLMKTQKPGVAIEKAKRENEFMEKVEKITLPDLHALSREHPSDRYHELIKMSQSMHQEGDPSLDIKSDAMFTGFSLLPHAGNIKKLIDQYHVHSVLDYGSGKGKQYKVTIKFGNAEFKDVLSLWGDPALTCYDPGCEIFSTLPKGHYDAVISTDMLEHCDENDVSWILREMFSFATKCVYFNIAAYPAQKKLPNGENAHVTIKPPEWWFKMINEIHREFPNIHGVAVIDQGKGLPSLTVML